MPEKSPEQQTLENIVSEYVRLSREVIDMTSGSFEDFKLFAVIGAILGWQPLVNYLATGKGVDIVILFWGFVGLFAIVALISLRHLVKQSIIFFTITRLPEYEKAIQELLPIHKTGVFSTYGDWNVWLKERHRWADLAFNLVLLLTTILIPFVVLTRSGDSYYRWIYGAVCVLFYALYFALSVRIIKPWTRKANG